MISGEYKCPECGETFRLIRDVNTEEPWFLDVVHDHAPSTQDAGVWTAVVYLHNKGQRYPAEYKELVERKAEQKREAKEEAKAEKVAENARTCPLHPEGCEHE